MSGSFVLVNEASVNHRIDHWYRVLIRLSCGLKIAFSKIIINLFDVGAIFRSMTCVALTVRFRLPSTFTGLWTVCQSREYLEFFQTNSPIRDRGESELYELSLDAQLSLADLIMRDLSIGT